MRTDTIPHRAVWRLLQVDNFLCYLLPMAHPLGSLVIIFATYLCLHFRDTNESTPPPSVDAASAMMHLASGTQPQQMPPQPMSVPSSVGRIKMAALEQDARLRVPVPQPSRPQTFLGPSSGPQLHPAMFAGVGGGDSNRWGLESVDFRPADAAAIASQAPQ